MRILSMLLLAVFLVALIVVAVVSFIGRERALELAFGPVKREPVDFATLVKKPSPNQFLVCTSEYCPAQPADREAQIYDVPVERLERAFWTMLAKQERVEQLESPVADQHDVVQFSRLMRYPDTVTVKFVPLGPDRSTLILYSRSHYGYGDMGVNKARVETWLAALEADLKAMPAS
jgi:hypothetical protein